MRVAVLGASGLVGRKMLELLEACTWLDSEPRLLTSARSAGCRIPFRNQTLTCQEVAENSFEGMDLAIFSAGGGTSRQWAQVAAASGCLVIDNSSAWRMDPQCPLVVPEINGQLIPATAGIVANPNCSTIQIVMAVAPLDREFGVRECHVTTLQAVSGAGQAAVSELEEQTRQYPQVPAGESHYPRPMAFNALPAIGAKTEDGGYEEETKVLKEMRRILGRASDLQVTCTATRVPVITGHSAAVRVVCEKDITCEDALAALGEMPGLVVTNDPHDYHTAREIAGRPEVFVGRVRRDPGNRKALLFWVVADNLMKGAAWNAIQIAESAAGSRRG